MIPVTAARYLRPAAWLCRLVGRWRALRRLARYRRTARSRRLATERWASAYLRHRR